MRPVLPEGYTVVYEYGETNVTPAGRDLLFPHRYTKAVVVNEGEDEVFTGIAICREGPALDDDPVLFTKLALMRVDGPVRLTFGGRGRPGDGGYDNFSKKIGRDIALGRALKKLYAAKEPVA